MIGYVSYHCVERLPIGVKVPVRLWVAYTKTFYQGIQAKVSFERRDVEFVDRRDATFLVNYLTFLELA